MLKADRQSAQMSKIINGGLTQSVWHRMLYSCTHMATAGIKGLISYQPPLRYVYAFKVWQKCKA